MAINYLRRVQPRNYSQVGDVERGLSIGQQIGGLMTPIAEAVAAYKKDKIANQLMAEQGMANMPAAQSLGKLPAGGGADQPMDLSGYTGAGPNVGLAAPTGGVAELQMRQEIEKQKAASALGAANLAHVQAQTGLAGAQARRTRLLPTEKAPAKPGKYVPGSSDINDPASDDFGKIRIDFEAQHGGKGSYEAFTKNMNNLVDDGKGNLAVAGPDGKPAMKDDGVTPLYAIPKADATRWINRYEAARIRSGQGRLSALPQGVNPGSGQASGTQTNAIPWDGKDPLLPRSLPDGTWVQLPDGSAKQIRRSAKTQQPTESATDTSSDTSSTNDQTTEENVNASS